MTMLAPSTVMPIGHRAVEAAEIIQRTFLHRLAAMNVHGVVGDHAHALGRLLLHDGGDHRRLVAVIDGGAGQPPRRIEQIGGRRRCAPRRSWIASKRPIGTWNCSRMRA